MSLVGLCIKTVEEIILTFHTIKKGDTGVVLTGSNGIIHVKFPFRKLGVNLFVGEWEVIAPTVTKEELEQLL